MSSTTTDERSTDDVPSPSLASQCIRALLDRHGVPKYKHAAEVALALGISYQKAYRKMTNAPGGALWTLEEMQTIGDRWGERLTDMLSAMHLDSSHSAVLVIGSVRATCRLWPGPVNHAPQAGELVAIRASSEWLVMPGSNAATGQCFAIDRLVIDRAQARSRRLAVLDDVPQIGAALAADMREMGFEAEAFDDEDALVEALRAAPFDGYVIDWRLGRGNAVKVIEKIRQINPGCPIILLSGEVPTGSPAESEVAQAQTAYRLRFQRKPASAPILASEFRLAFAAG